MLTLIHLHFRKDLVVLTTWVGIVLVISLAGAVLQMAGSGVISVGHIVPGWLLGFIIPVVVFARGKHGEGKCISRMPVHRWIVFAAQFIYGILAVLAFFLMLYVGLELVRGLVVASGNEVSPSVLLDGSRWANELGSFAFSYPIMVFIIALVRYLQKWMSREHAMALIVVVPLVILIGIPVLIGIFRQDAVAGANTFSPVFDWLMRNREPISYVIKVMLIAGSLFLFRIRRFRSF